MLKSVDSKKPPPSQDPSDDDYLYCDDYRYRDSAGNPPKGGPFFDGYAHEPSKQFMRDLELFARDIEPDESLHHYMKRKACYESTTAVHHLGTQRWLEPDMYDMPRTKPLSALELKLRQCLKADGYYDTTVEWVQTYFWEVGQKLGLARIIRAYDNGMTEDEELVGDAILVTHVLDLDAGGDYVPVLAPTLYVNGSRYIVRLLDVEVSRRCLTQIEGARKDNRALARPIAVLGESHLRPLAITTNKNRDRFLYTIDGVFIVRHKECAGYERGLLRIEGFIAACMLQGQHKACYDTYITTEHKMHFTSVLRAIPL